MTGKSLGELLQQLEKMLVITVVAKDPAALNPSRDDVVPRLSLLDSRWSSHRAQDGAVLDRRQV